MAGTFIEVKVDGADEFRTALDLLMKRGQNLAPVFADIGEYLLIAHDERFKRQVSPDGKKWTDLNPEYKERKKQNKDRILVLDGELAGTLRYQATAESLIFGTDRKYGATHQFGRNETVSGKTGATYDANIPARPFLGFSGDDVSEARRLLSGWLSGE
jgi:phage virion morphogenesis protein